MRRKDFFVFFLIAFLCFFTFTFVVKADAVSDRQALLQNELEQLNRDILAQQQILDTKRKETGSIERDIAILNAQISQAKLSIQASNIKLEQLGKDIGSKANTIQTLEVRIEKNKESLGDLIRKTNEIDRYSLTEAILADKTLSNFFSDLDFYQIVKKSLHDVFLQISDAKAETETEKVSLEKKSKQEVDARAVIVAKKTQIEGDEKQKKKLLSFSKEEEKTYEAYIAEKQRQAAQIRTALFGLRDTAAIPFGTAYQYALDVEKVTGVRPAFLLAILTQETNLGQNVGTCNRAGDPPEKGWRVIMKPDRDHAPYLALTSELGLNPDIMPLSCPIKGVGGWGGGMGPAQFIPSTWQMYKARIANSLGIQTANPWNPKDAFTASALFLADLGADERGYSAEREAALRYYAGGNWKLAKNAFYGNGVMAKAASIQTNMIDPLNNI